MKAASAVCVTKTTTTLSIVLPGGVAYRINPASGRIVLEGPLDQIQDLLQQALNAVTR